MVARSHCGPRVSVLVSSWLVSQALSSLTTTVVQLHCKTYWLTTTSNKNHHLNTLTHIKTILYCALHITVCLYRMSFNAYYYRNYFIMNHLSLSLSLSLPSTLTSTSSYWCVFARMYKLYRCGSCYYIVKYSLYLQLGLTDVHFLQRDDEL